MPSVGDSYGRRARRRRRELRIDWDFPSVEPPDYLLQLNPDLTLAVEVGIVLAALLYIRKVTRTTTVVRVTTDDVEHGRVHLLQDKPIPDYVAGSRSRIFTRLRA